MELVHGVKLSSNPCAKLYSMQWRDISNAWSILYGPIEEVDELGFDS